MSGLSAIDVGVSSISGWGDVYNLKRLPDFNGTYASVSAEATLGGGEAAHLRRLESSWIHLGDMFDQLDQCLSAARSAGWPAHANGAEISTDGASANASLEPLSEGGDTGNGYSERTE